MKKSRKETIKQKHKIICTSHKTQFIAHARAQIHVFNSLRARIFNSSRTFSLLQFIEQKKMLKFFYFCYVFASFFLTFSPVAAFYLEYCKLLELSWPFNNQTIYWPNAPPFKLDQ